MSASGDEPAPELVEALKAWRLQTARDRNVPAYIVFNDKTLEEIARIRPTTERELLSVTGIGATKLETYGDDILALISDS
ncbi:MAG: HRDC domain-containing protein, partial [Acidimicrobiia bacterium]|nr:HRDC domain-containing protein [Acidimicrobiia bacterium]